MALPSESTLHLIQRLAELDHSSLSALARKRHVRPADLASLTTLAMSLLDDASVSAAVRALPREALTTIAALSTTGALDGDISELVTQGLVDPSSDPPRLLCQPEQLGVLGTLSNGATPPSLASRGTLGLTERSRAASVAVTLLCQLDDLLEAMGPKAHSANKDHALGVTAQRALAENLGDGYNIVLLVRLAYLTRLLQHTGGELRLTSQVERWRQLSHWEQWREVAGAWWQTMPPWLGDVVRRFPGAHWADDVPRLTEYYYPLLDANAEIAEANEEARALGVTEQGLPTPWGEQLWGDNPDADFTPYLPGEVPGVYPHEDFTLLAPGPLSREHRLILDTLAERELGGLVPRYRLTPHSIVRALQQGTPASKITPLLQSTSQTPLPQGMVHLVDDTSRRAHDIELRGSGNGTILTVVNNQLGNELMADPALRPLSLAPVTDGTLISSWPVERVRNTLLGSRYLALIVDREGASVPSATAVVDAHATDTDPLTVAVDKLFSSIQSAAGHGVPPWLGSVIDVAMSRKMPLEIELEMPGGESLIMVMEPRSLSNGRLRGVELKNSMEKTIPVSAIRRVTPWDATATP